MTTSTCPSVLLRNWMPICDAVPQEPISRGIAFFNSILDRCSFTQRNLHLRAVRGSYQDYFNQFSFRKLTSCGRWRDEWGQGAPSVSCQSENVALEQALKLLKERTIITTEDSILLWKVIWKADVNETLGRSHSARAATRWTAWVPKLLPTTPCRVDAVSPLSFTAKLWN